MLPTCERIIGGPGAGKTARLLGIIDRVTNKLGIDPLQIGFVSFTRAARQHAASRAAKRFNISPNSLEKEGWFRTLHSVCFRQLRVAPGELLTGTKDDNEWLRKALSDPNVRVARTEVEHDVSDNPDRIGRSIDEACLFLPANDSDSGRALALWDAARNQLVPMAEVWAKVYDMDSRTPRLEVCRDTVSLYEKLKGRDGRLDFCDLLMLFAGKRWTGSHDGAFQDVEPHGDVPHLPVWIHDEMQDCSLLTSLVFARLIRDSTWVYLAGDRNQEIYSWAGACGDIFSRWPCAKEDFLTVSHRCDRNILDVGKRVIKDPRLAEFNPANEGGEIIRGALDAALRGVRPDEDCLVLARTNEYARSAARILDDLGTPWKSTKGGFGRKVPARTAGIAAIVALRHGQGINGEGVHRMMELFNVSTPDGTRLFEQGAKAFYEDKERRAGAHRTEPLTLQALTGAGCTLAFKEMVASGRYIELLDEPAAKIAVAAQKHGIEVVVNPSVRIGTCHSAKGMESDHVILLNQIPFPTVRNCETQQGLQEERRVWYVSATRARHKLTIAECEGNVFEEL